MIQCFSYKNKCFLQKDTRRDEMKIAILGFGTIGSGVYEILAQSKKHQVIKVLDLPSNKDKLEMITSDINDIIQDKEIELVVETMGGIHPAYEFIMQCLNHKKHVVSANKAVIAKYINEFLATAKANQVSFFFEASVGGGIPWIASLIKAARIDEVDAFYGIFNGTTNFILDHMYKNGSSFQEVLSLAQDLGYAEADPSADIDGYDVANKVAISCAVAFHHQLPVASIPCVGIRCITKEDIHYFARQNKCVKLIGEGRKLNDCFTASVLPTIFNKDSMEASVPGNFNIASLQTDTIGELKFYGQGAGKLPTANAIVQDIIDIQEQKEMHVVLDKPLHFDSTLLSERFIIRTTNNLKNQWIIKKEWNYYYTDFISLKQAIELYKECKSLDATTTLFKLANY